MAKSTFEKRLDEVLETVLVQKALTPYDQTKDRLRLVCDRIERILGGTSKKVLVSLQPGFKANLGQQVNVVVEVPNGSTGTPFSVPTSRTKGGQSHWTSTGNNLCPPARLRIWRRRYLTS